MLNPRVINIQMFIERLEHHIPPSPSRRDCWYKIWHHRQAPYWLQRFSTFRTTSVSASLISSQFRRQSWLVQVQYWCFGPKWVMLKGKSAVKNWKIWVRFTIWLVCETGDLHFSKYQTRLSIKKFPRFRHSTAVGRDRSNMLQKGLGMLTTVINLHFICSVHVCFSNYSNS